MHSKNIILLCEITDENDKETENYHVCHGTLKFSNEKKLKNKNIQSIFMFCVNLSFPKVKKANNNFSLLFIKCKFGM